MQVDFNRLGLGRVGKSLPLPEQDKPGISRADFVCGGKLLGGLSTNKRAETGKKQRPRDCPDGILRY
jgi:hypothetical protein